jgi:hypothetical protein
MSKFVEKTKYTLDWLQHGYLLVQILAAFGVGKAVNAILGSYTKIPSVWITPIWLLVSAATVALFVVIGNKLSRGAGQSSSAPQLSVPATNFNVSVFLQTAYIGALQQETETNVRSAATQNQPNDREEFYVKLIGVGLIGFTYELVWAYIYRSQLLLLMELNRRILTLAECKAFYDDAVSKNPGTVYPEYTFEKWMNFFKVNSLLVWHPSDMVQITVRGQDFLKYLTHCGHYADQRKL